MTVNTTENRAAALVGDSLLDRRELADLIGMSPGAINVALCRGSFPLKPIRIGSRLRWRASAVRAFLDQAGEAAIK